MQHIETPVLCALHLHHITIASLPMLPAANALEKLKVHPILQHLTLDGVVSFTCFASHLRCNILQPQPIPPSNLSIAPAILPQPITVFLGISLGIYSDVVEDCWDILQDHVWEIPIPPLTFRGLSVVQVLHAS